MIQNLNQVAFQRFGVTLPERKQLPQTQQFQEQWLLSAGLNEIPLYQATEDTYLSLRNGKSILSVSYEKESFDHFYFDKQVCIRTGTYFFLSPFKGDATVLVCASSAPNQIGHHPISNLRIDRNLRIDGIYTFFYQAGTDLCGPGRIAQCNRRRGYSAQTRRYCFLRPESVAHALR